MDPKMKAKLAKFNKNFNKDKKKADELGGFAEIPDGKYLSKLTSCELKNSNAGELHFVFMFEILESAEDESLVGAKATKWCNIEKEDGGAYLIRDLRRFGIELDSLEDLPEVAKLLDDQKPELKISLKTGNSGQFTYIDTVISEIDTGDFEQPEADEDSDEEEEEDETVEADEEEVEEDEDSEETSEEEDVDLEVGMTVSYTSKSGKEMIGKITQVLDKEEAVKVDVGGKVFKIEASRLSIPEVQPELEEDEEIDEEENEEPAPVVKKAAAKTTAKSAVKKTSTKKTTLAKKAAGKKR